MCCSLAWVGVRFLCLLVLEHRSLTPTQAKEQHKSQHSLHSLAQSNLRLPSHKRGNGTIPAKDWMDDKLTLKLTGVVNKSQSAIFIQSVDPQMSHSSYYDLPFSAFFIDP